MIDCEKLTELSQILCSIPRNEGEHLISFSSMSAGFDWFTIKAMLNWKCDNRYYECRSLDEGIEIAKKLYREIVGYEYHERDIS